LGLFRDSRSSFAHRFPEPGMDERAVILGLLIASLTNVVCLYSYL
jgi:hypothetical protein